MSQGLFRGLEHHLVVGGDGGRHLVGHLIERVVEGGVGNGAQGLALRVDARRRPDAHVAGEGLAVVAEGGVGGGARYAGAPHLVERVLLAEAGFRGDEVRDLLAPGGETLGGG